LSDINGGGVNDEPEPEWALVVDTIVQVLDPDPGFAGECFMARITVRSERNLRWPADIGEELRAVLNRVTRSMGVPPPSRITDDPTDSRLTHGPDDPAEPSPGMAEVYLVLSAEERQKGFIRPVRQTYIHDLCTTVTRMGISLAETYAANPRFYGATYCATCRLHRPVGPNGEFAWEDGTRVGT